jgi:acetylornithine deacetylase
MLDVVDTLRDLVRIPSVNPMGRDVAGDIYFENRLTDHLAKIVRRMGMTSERHTVAPGRDNLIARLESRAASRSSDRVVMLEVHQDTVPVDGMTIDPWGGQVRQGRLYGRGACDIKGGMASVLVALSRLADERPADMPTVLLACSVNEEYGFSGAARLRQLWSDGTSEILRRAPDVIIVAEPTELDVVVAHQGILRWRCQTCGHAAHSSSPRLGHNAIYDMGRVLAAIQEYERDVVAKIEPHPLAGPPAMNVGMIEGGISVNTVPDRCRIDVERRLLPHEDPDAAYRDAVEYLDRYCAGQRPIEHHPPYMAAGGLTDKDNTPLADQLAKVAQELGLPCRKTGVRFGTDACELARDGVPTVVFGPGSVAQAHTSDEWVAIDQLEKAAEILYEFIRRGAIA